MYLEKKMKVKLFVKFIVLFNIHHNLQTDWFNFNPLYLPLLSCATRDYYYITLHLI